MSLCYAVVKNGVVENVIAADDSFEIEGYELIKYDNKETSVSPGDSYANGKFIRAADEVP